MDAASAIIDTEPTTILGATARLRYVAKHESAGNTFDFIDDDDGKTKPWTFVVMHNTTDALEKMIGGRVTSRARGRQLGDQNGRAP
jgi:hypothetical protein